MMAEIAVPIAHTVPQAGFWRRLFALAIDYAVFVFAGILLFQATGGVLRVGDLAAVQNKACISSVVRVERSSTVSQTTTETCERAVLGLVYDRWTEVSELTQSGDAAVTHTMRTPVDAAGRPVRAFYLDQVLMLLLVAYLGVAEWLFGTTLGKRVVGVRVRMQDGSRLRLGNACRRLIRFVPALALIPAVATGTAPASLEGTALTVMLSLDALSAILWVAILANFVIAIFNDDLPWHDRWAGTEVVIAR